MSHATPLQRLDDDALDELIAGRAPSTAGGLDQLAAFLRDLRDETREVAADPDLCALLAAEAQLALDSEGPLVAASPGSPRRLRRVAVAIGAVAGSVVLTGGLATADVLPDPAQRVVADVADQVGLDLPRPSDDTDHNPVSAEPEADDDARVPDLPAQADDHAGGGRSVANLDLAQAAAHGEAVANVARDRTADDECGTHGTAVSAVARTEESCTPPPGRSETPGEGDTAPAQTPDPAAPDDRPGADAAESRPAGPREDGPPAEKAEPDTVPPVPPVPPSHADAAAADPPADAEQPEPPSNVGTEMPKTTGAPVDG